MKKIKVFDWPTRLFHWMFALGFASAYFIADTADDESVLFPVHMLIGLTIAAMVLLRIIWGFLGSRFARFSSFPIQPQQLIGYLTSIFTSTKRRFVGHNPASAWAAMIMLLLALSLAVTGIMMVRGAGGESLEEVHELLANGFLVVVIAHIAGVVLHHIRHRDGTALSMVHGRKAALDGEASIKSSHPLVAGGFLVFIALLVLYQWQNYDATTRQLKVFGTQLQLNESEHEDHPESESSEHRDSDD